MKWQRRCITADEPVGQAIDKEDESDLFLAMFCTMANDINIGAANAQSSLRFIKFCKAIQISLLLKWSAWWEVFELIFD